MTASSHALYIYLYLLYYYKIIVLLVIIIKKQLIFILGLFELEGNSTQLAYTYIKCWMRWLQKAGGGGGCVKIQRRLSSGSDDRKVDG
jgi:hypothetical protein